MGLKSSLDEILKNIERAKRNTFTKKDVILVAATKTRSFNQINQVYSLGIRHIGENRIQEAEGKFESFEEMPKITRRFIGLSLIHISEPTRLRRISYAVFCL